MKFRFDEIPISPQDPFAHCKLGRQMFGDFLTEIIEKTEDGFVLSINNKWGDGKTTFLRMWEQQLKNNEYKVIHFNAWENDFEDNPLVAFMAELKKIFGSSKNYINTVSAISTMFKEVGPAVAKGYVQRKIGKEASEDIAAAVKGLSVIFEKNIENYDKTKNARSAFKSSLQKWIADSASKTPVIFVIDELDRCRPNYSVLLLEQLKHFFSVPNIVFVLAIDKEQLSHAVKGLYGSDSIDGEEYLRRFIDIEYSLPKIPSTYFIDNLIDKYDLSEWRSKMNFTPEKSISFKELIFLFDQHNISLRVQEKIISHLSIIVKTHENSKLYSKVFCFLLFIKHYDTELFNKIKNKVISLPDLEEHLKIIYETRQSFLKKREIANIKAYILVFYYSYANRVITSEKSLYMPSNDGFNLSSVDPMVQQLLQPIQNEYKNDNAGNVIYLIDLIIIQ